MSYESIRSAIENRFNQGWGSTTPVKWSNIEFKHTPKQDFVMFYILDALTARAEITMNNPLHRSTGIIQVNIYAKLHTGMNAINTYIESILAIYRDVTFSGITCFDHAVNHLGEMHGWYTVAVSFTFRADFRYTALIDAGIVFDNTTGIEWTDTTGNEWEDRA